MKKLKVSLGIPTYRGAWRVNNLLRSIYTCKDSRDVSITVLDDGSPNWGETEDVVRSWHPKLNVHLLRRPHNRGISASWNGLTQLSNSEIVILINDDIIVSEGWLKSLVYFLEHNKCGGVSLPNYFIIEEDIPKIFAGKGFVPRDPLTKEPKPQLLEQDKGGVNRPGRIMVASGCLFAFKREVYDLVGGFDERFVSFYEDMDFGTKLAEEGYPSYGLTWPHCFHMWSATFSSSPELKPHETLLRSRDYYCDKWDVPDRFREDPCSYTNPKYMSRIQRQKIKWIDKFGKEHEEWI